MRACCVTMSSNLGHPFVPREFRGKWNRSAYCIQGELGRGANGRVFLAHSAGKKVAVKVGSEAFDILMEVNMLKNVKPLSGMPIGPRLYEVDDIVVQGKPLTFYAMEYVEGEMLDVFVERAGRDWIPILMIQLLSRLHILHIQGWVFGDVKPENVMISGKDRQMRLIDFGGVSKIGHAVRQFTEEYDRGAWKAGDRRAEPGYDLFAVAVLMVRLAIGKEAWRRISQQERNTQTLCDIIRSDSNLYPFRQPLIHALCGKQASAQAMKNEMVAALQGRTENRPKGKRQDTLGTWIGGMFVASLLLSAGLLYLAWM